MWDRVIQYLVGLSGRERWLLAVLLVVALPVAAVFGLVLPLSQARAAARAQVHEARLIEQWVADQASDYLAQGAALGADLRAAGAGLSAETPPPVGISGIEQSLVTAGLRTDVSELANSADGGVTLRFEAVAFTGLTAWLSQNDASWGYDLEAFKFTRLERDDAVEAELKLVPAQ